MTLLELFDPAQGIYETSQKLGGVVDEGLAILEWAKREPIYAAGVFGAPTLLLGWAFGRSRRDRSMEDWSTRG